MLFPPGLLFGLLLGLLPGGLLLATGLGSRSGKTLIGVSVELSPAFTGDDGGDGSDEGSN